jgi:hypothetical protein
VSCGAAFAEQPLPRYEPCLPRPAKQPPPGPGWIHEIKHDGFRIIAPDTPLIDKLLVQAWVQKSPKSIPDLGPTVDIGRRKIDVPFTPKSGN